MFPYKNSPLRNINSKSSIHHGILTESLPEHDFTDAMLNLIQENFNQRLELSLVHLGEKDARRSIYASSDG
jgi:hypothetical protein